MINISESHEGQYGYHIKNDLSEILDLYEKLHRAVINLDHYISTCDVGTINPDLISGVSQFEFSITNLRPDIRKLATDTEIYNKLR